MICDIFHSFSSAYPNNAECTWEITADNGYSIGLVFVDRFHLESSPNCEKDYVQVITTMRLHCNEIRDKFEKLHRSTFVSSSKVVSISKVNLI